MWAIGATVSQIANEDEFSSIWVSPVVTVAHISHQDVESFNFSVNISHYINRAVKE